MNGECILFQITYWIPDTTHQVEPRTIQGLKDTRHLGTVLLHCWTWVYCKENVGKNWLLRHRRAALTEGSDFCSWQHDRHRVKVQKDLGDFVFQLPLSEANKTLNGSDQISILSRKQLSKVQVSPLSCWTRTARRKSDCPLHYRGDKNDTSVRTLKPLQRGPLTAQGRPNALSYSDLTTAHILY